MSGGTYGARLTGSSNMTSCRREASPGTPESTVKIDSVFKLDKVSGMRVKGLFWIHNSVRHVRHPSSDGRVSKTL